MPCSPTEAIAKAHSDIDSCAQKFRDGLRVTANPKDFELFSTWLFDRNTPPSDLLPVFCCLANPIMKEGAERTVEAKWPKKFIASDEREEQLATLRHEIEEAERVEEQMTVELEAVGAKIDRRADLNPAIYLEFKDANHWNKKKLDDLWSSISGERSRVSDVGNEIRDISFELATQRSLAERSMTVNDKERFQRKAADLERVKTEVLTRRDTIEAKLSPMHKLHNACLDFLRSKGVEGFGGAIVARVVSRAG